jgi:tetratricopeptide (TPR) repeat protein
MLPRRRVLALWTLAALGILLGPWGVASSLVLPSRPQEPSHPAAWRPASHQSAWRTASAGRRVISSPSTTAARRVALFGIDAADWREVDRLVAAGKLPAFARLAQVAARGVLRADPPLLSPIIWTTIATGRRPEDHGVLDFMVDIPGGGQAPVGGGARKTKALWEMWSEAGRVAEVVGWWATWPADHVRGLVASDRIATPHVAARRPNAGLVHPAGAIRDVDALIVDPLSIGLEELGRLVPTTPGDLAQADRASRQTDGRLYRNRLAHFRAAVAATRSYRRIATRYASSLRPDFCAVYFDIVDTASHLFVTDPARGPRAIESGYREVDAALAESIGVLDPDTLVLVLSDHGFHPPDAGIREDPADLTAGATAWHRPYGIVAATTAGAMAGTRPSPRFGPLGVVSPLDIAPTLLAWAGLPVAADMPGHVLPALVPPTDRLVRIPSHGAHVLPEAATPASSEAAAELERLRALGYVSGAAATSSLARVNLGEVLYRRGDFRGSARELEAALRADPLAERASMWLARAYIALGRRTDAAGIYDRMVQASRSASVPLDPVAVLAATDNDLASGRVDAARTRLALVPPDVRDTPEGQVAAGSVARAQGRLELAQDAFRAALRQAPGDFEARQRLMDTLLAAHREADALVLASDGARRFPSSPQHAALAGEAALAARRYPQAERLFAAALDLAPDADSVRIELARARLLGGRPAAALEALRGVSSSRDAEMVRGASLSAQQDWPGAIAAYERALTLGDPVPDLLNAMAAAQLQAGRAAAAVASLERSLALAPNQPSARALLERARAK